MRNNSLNELGRLKTDIWYGGAWHAPMGGQYRATVNPGTGKPIVDVAESDAEDVAAAVRSAKTAAADWGDTPPLQRAKALRAIAEIVRKNARELALIDAANCGNPVAAMVGDAEVAAAQLDFFAGLVTEIKGASIPMGRDTVNFSVRQPLGVVARIFAFNHPFMFCAGKMAAPLAAGNTLVVKPPDQAPLSALRLAEMIEGVLPRVCSTSCRAGGRRAPP
jgi:betaine-aldehyde dehydrogenase